MLHRREPLVGAAGATLAFAMRRASAAERAACDLLAPQELPAGPGNYVVMARATNRVGAGQTFQPIFNPAGYHHNVVQRVGIVVS